MQVELDWDDGGKPCCSTWNIERCTARRSRNVPRGTELEHFHFYSVQASVANAAFLGEKPRRILVTLYTPEAKML